MAKQRKKTSEMSSSRNTDSFFKTLYKGLIIGESSLQHLLLLVLRLYFGVLLFFAGFGKLSNISNVAGYFTELNIVYPTLNAYLVAIVEGLGGVLLVLGFGTRLITIPLIVIMIVAYVTAHPEAIQALWSNPSLFTSQDAFLYLLVSLLIMIFGPGALSIDYWIERKLFSKNK